MNLSDLVLENKKKEQIHLDLFHEVLKRCHELIKQKNKSGCKHIVYDIPLLMWGKPKYNVIAMRNYLLDHLHENGFFVEVVGNGRSLYICWDETMLDLEKFYQNKAKIDRQYSMNRVLPSLPATVDQSTMMFRQQKQRELKEEREKRFNLQRRRFTGLDQKVRSSA